MEPATISLCAVTTNKYKKSNSFNEQTSNSGR